MGEATALRKRSCVGCGGTPTWEIGRRGVFFCSRCMQSPHFHFWRGNTRGNVRVHYATGSLTPRCSMIERPAAAKLGGSNAFSFSLKRCCDPMFPPWAGVGWQTERAGPWDGPHPVRK